MNEEFQLEPGVRHVSPITSVTAASAPTALYTLSVGRSCRVKKIHIHNQNVVNTFVQIGTGTGASYVQAINDIGCIAGMDLELTEEQIMQVEFMANITVQCTAAAAAPNTVLVQVEVEEYQGING